MLSGKQLLDGRSNRVREMSCLRSRTEAGNMIKPEEEFSTIAHCDRSYTSEFISPVLIFPFLKCQSLFKPDNCKERSENLREKIQPLPPKKTGQTGVTS